MLEAFLMRDNVLVDEFGAAFREEDLIELGQVLGRVYRRYFLLVMIGCCSCRHRTFVVFFEVLLDDTDDITSRRNV